MKKIFALLVCLCMMLSCNYCIAENEEEAWLYQECMNAKTELLQWMGTRYYTTNTPDTTRNTLLLQLAAAPQNFYRLELKDSFRFVFLTAIGGAENDPKMQAKIENGLPSTAIAMLSSDAVNQMMTGTGTGTVHSLIENNQISIGELLPLINITRTNYLVDRPAFLTQPQLLWMEYANGFSLLVALTPNTDYGFVDVQIMLQPFSASSLAAFFDLHPLSVTP